MKDQAFFFFPQPLLKTHLKRMLQLERRRTLQKLARVKTHYRKTVEKQAQTRSWMELHLYP